MDVGLPGAASRYPIRVRIISTNCHSILASILASKFKVQLVTAICCGVPRTDRVAAMNVVDTRRNSDTKTNKANLNHAPGVGVRKLVTRVDLQSIPWAPSMDL